MLVALRAAWLAARPMPFCNFKLGFGRCNLCVRCSHVAILAGLCFGLFSAIRSIAVEAGAVLVAK